MSEKKITVIIIFGNKKIVLFMLITLAQKHDKLKFIRIMNDKVAVSVPFPQLVKQKRAMEVNNLPL